MTFLPKFICERVNVNLVLAAIDQDLILFGISTFGDRCSLRDACKRRKDYNIPT